MDTHPAVIENLIVAEMTREELQENERVIERGKQTFIDVGLALLAIRDGRGYRFEYVTFEDYCQRRWGWTRGRANQLIAASNYVKGLDTTVSKIPDTEREARAMMRAERQPVKDEIEEEDFDDYEFNRQQILEANRQGACIPVPEKRPVSYHVSDDSYEWYTPEEYIEAARSVMGGIDLDPASSDEAQEVIKAKQHYTKNDDGLQQIWRGRVWLNPPYNMPLIEQFIDQVIEEYEAGNVTSAIVLTNNSTDTAWFHKLIRFPVCLTRGRIQFWHGDETLATRQGQALFYLGKHPEKFAKTFKQFGAVLRLYDDQ